MYFWDTRYNFYRDLYQHLNRCLDVNKYNKHPVKGRIGS